MIPFYIFYSIFGFQRVGDMIWACGDMMCKGFLLGGTSGRTTLNGEGVQHQDGHSHLVASTIPNLKSYDPAFAFEIALIVRDGIRRMYVDQQDVFYYLTLTNQNYPQPAIPEKAGAPEADLDDVELGVLSGMYCFARRANARINLFGSGAIMVEVLRAATLLGELGYPCNVWSVTSYNELARDGLAADRLGLFSMGVGAGSASVPENDDGEPVEACRGWVERQLAGEQGVFIAASDYVKALPLSIGRWIPGPYTVLGTDGFGLSEGRPELRDHFEVSAAWIGYAALATAAREEAAMLEPARAFARSHRLDLGKADPAGA